MFVKGKERERRLEKDGRKNKYRRKIRSADMSDLEKGRYQIEIVFNQMVGKF